MIKIIALPIAIFLAGTMIAGALVFAARYRIHPLPHGYAIYDRFTEELWACQFESSNSVIVVCGDAKVRWIE